MFVITLLHMQFHQYVTVAAFGVTSTLQITRYFSHDHYAITCYVCHYTASHAVP